MFCVDDYEISWCLPGSFRSRKLIAVEEAATYLAGDGKDDDLV